MRNGNSKYWWKLMHSPITMVAALVLLFFLARSAWNVHRSADLASAKLAQTSAELADLKTEQQSLSAKINTLSTPSGIESELRTKFRAVKEGESVAVIIGDTESSTSEASTTPQAGWWGRFLGFFGI